MAETEHPFILYDGHILMLLRDNSRRAFRPLSGHLHPFEDLQHLDLMQALVSRKYPTATSLIKKLTAPLPPKDAAAACLCALAGSEKLMHTLLDHCPPIPEFQFLGVGKTASLLNVAARFNKHKMLDLLLKRGASPNGGPTPQTAATPLETAFCNDAYLCLERLLKLPDLPVELTHNMLVHWGTLKPDPNAPCPTDLMCCQLLKERLTGEPIDFRDPMPFPPQLRLENALEHLNLPLATHICQKRPLTEQEMASAIRYFAGGHRIALLDERALDIFLKEHQANTDFLLSVLTRCPKLVQLPAMRFPIISTALVPPQPDAALQHWVAQLEDGPVFLKELSAAGGTYAGGRPYPKLFSNFTLSGVLFPRWDARLGSRLVPTMDVSADLYLPFMSDDEVQLVLDRVSFVGERPADKVSTVAEQFLLYAPEALLPGLLQPGGLLTKESPTAVLNFCQALPAHRRNLILPHFHKNVSYEL